MTKTVDLIPQSSFEALQRYHWPGNIRELRNVIQRSKIVSHGGVLQVDLPNASTGPISLTATALTLDDVPRQHNLAVLNNTGWRISGPHGAAALLGVKPTTLEYRINKLGISRPSAGPG